MVPGILSYAAVPLAGRDLRSAIAAGQPGREWRTAALVASQRPGRAPLVRPHRSEKGKVRGQDGDGSDCTTRPLSGAPPRRSSSGREPTGVLQSAVGGSRLSDWEEKQLGLAAPAGSWSSALRAPGQGPATVGL